MPPQASTAHPNIVAELNQLHDHAPHGHAAWAMANRQVQEMRELNFAAREDWGKLRLLLANLLRAQLFNDAMLALICANFGFVWYETDLKTVQFGEKEAAEVPTWISHVALCFLVVYTSELAARFYVWRKRCLSDFHHLMDMAVVVADCVVQYAVLIWKVELPSVCVLRIVRLALLILRVDVLTRSREMYIMLNGFVGAMKAIMCGIPVIVGIVLLWAMISVELLNPVNLKIAETGYYDDVDCPRCPRAFNSVSEAFFTFFQQVVVADDWGTISMPLIEASPWIAPPLLTLVFVTVNLGVLNLLLTIIVDSAQEMRIRNKELQLQMKESESEHAKHVLLVMCAELDADKSGFLTLSELTEGYDTNEKFSHMLKLIDVGKEDMVTMFKVLDEDASGSVSYNEFIEQLNKMKTQEMRTILVFLKAHILDIQKDVSSQLQILRQELLPIQICIKTLLDQFSNNSTSTSAAPAHGNAALSNGVDGEATCQESSMTKASGLAIAEVSPLVVCNRSHLTGAPHPWSVEQDTSASGSMVTVELAALMDLKSKAQAQADAAAADAVQLQSLVTSLSNLCSGSGVRVVEVEQQFPLPTPTPWGGGSQAPTPQEDLSRDQDLTSHQHLPSPLRPQEEAGFDGPRGGARVRLAVTSSVAVKPQPSRGLTL